MQARLHEGPKGRFLWLLNQTRQTQTASVTVGGKPAKFGKTYWADSQAELTGGIATVPARDIVIVALEE